MREVTKPAEDQVATPSDVVVERPASEEAVD
jgi:hypothetical protein